jgi:hypothetical protein
MYLAQWTSRASSFPELQLRGLFRKALAGTTLRENLGLPVPVVGAQHVRR